ncbi:laminin subunit alpha, putative [Babesia caballi]|uniref:Laminin subunit alpha, putative n=1 Tax=Babesia caballi TaxID=5871 RepID=A0AAV4LWY7_BABCB|nr:laminin subunit alpha, putative [Babesia caballi]
MDAHDRMAKAAAEASMNARRDDAHGDGGAAEPAGSRETNDHAADRALIGGLQNLEVGMRSREAARTMGFGEYEQEPAAWHPSGDKAHPAAREHRDFVGAEAMQYGLTGLMEALRRYPELDAPIVTLEGVDTNRLRARIMES